MTEDEKQKIIHRSMSYEGVRYVHFLGNAGRWTVDRYTKEVRLNWSPESVVRERRLREFIKWEGAK